MIRKSYKNRGYRHSTDNNMNAIKWYIDSQINEIKTTPNINNSTANVRFIELEELYKNLSIKVDKLENYVSKDTSAITDIKNSNKDISDKVNNILNSSIEFMATKIDNLIISDIKNSKNIDNLLQNNIKYAAEFTKNNEKLLQSLNILLQQKVISNSSNTNPPDANPPDANPPDANPPDANPPDINE